MAITHIATGTGAPGAGGGWTAPFDSTGATLLVVGITSWGSGNPINNVADNYANTFTGLTVRVTGTARHRIYYCISPVTGPGHTVWASGAGNTYPIIIASAFAGSEIYHSESGATAASGASIASGIVTPPSNGALIFTGVAVANAGSTNTLSPAGFTLTHRNQASGGPNGSAGWLVQAVAAGIDPTWAFSPAQGAQTVNTAVFLDGLLTPPPARVSQLGLEVLERQDITLNARVSQVAMEVLERQDITLYARVSQVALEVLRIPAKSESSEQISIWID